MSKQQSTTDWKVTLKRLRHRLKLSYAWLLRQHADYQPLFVLGTGRSGSTLLVDYLRNLPNVDCGGEVLAPETVVGLRASEQSPTTAMRHIRRSLQSQRAAIRGCKLMLYHLEQCGLTVDQVQEAFPRAKYIVIYRESLVEQHVSECCARVTGQWMVRRGNTPKQARIRVDPQSLHLFVHTTRRHYENLLTHSWLRDHAALLSYEQLVANPRACFAERICPLLNLPALAPQTVLVKQNTRPLAERVENYAEVADVLSRPEYRQHYSWAHDGAAGQSRAA